MTTLPRRSHTALLVVDLQVGVVGEAYDRDRVVVNVATVVESARAAGVAVVWVQNANEEAPRGSEPWQIVDELTPRDDEPLVHKGYPDAFEKTDLEALLAGRGVGRLVVAGAQTDECIRATLHGAVVRGYDATLVSDAHTTMDLTSPRTARRRQLRSSPTPTSTGTTTKLLAGRATPARPPRCAGSGSPPTLSGLGSLHPKPFRDKEVR